MMIVKRQRLLAVACILGVIQIEYQALWRRGEAGDELLDEGLTDTLNVLPARHVFEARDRRA